MGLKKKKGIRYLYLTPNILVRLAGIEPTTPWFVAKYSIQLSYSREKQNYNIKSIISGRNICKNFYYFFLH
jgi:hypothetical protein